MGKQHLGDAYKVTTTVQTTDLANPGDLTPDAGTVVAAWCDQKGHVFVNSDAWTSTNGGQRQTIMFHELGHCELHREHLDTTKPGGTPVSLMDHVLLDWQVYEANQDYYNTELFSVDNRPKPTVADVKPAAEPVKPVVPVTYQINYLYNVQTTWNEYTCSEIVQAESKLVTVDKATFESKTGTAGCTGDADNLTCHLTDNTEDAVGNCSTTDQNGFRSTVIHYAKHVEPTF